MKQTPSHPIKRRSDILKIQEMLRHIPWNYALFTLGINTNLDLDDLLDIRIYQVENLPPGNSFDLVELNSGRKRSINLNAECTEAIARHLKACAPYHPDDLLFRTDAGTPTPTSLVDTLVRSWCIYADLTDNYTGETLRKTWAYVQNTRFGIDLATLKVCLDQPSEEATARYLTL